MQRNGKLLILALLLVHLFGFRLSAQSLSSDDLEQCRNWPRFSDISRFYQWNQNRLFWIGKKTQVGELLFLLNHAPSYGLNESDYQPAYISRWRSGMSLNTWADSVAADLRFTDAAIHFFCDIKNGNNKPSFGYNGLRFVPETESVVRALSAQSSNRSLDNFLAVLEPQSPEYAGGIRMLRRLLVRSTDPNLTEVRITSAKADSTNTALLVRLYQLGFTDSIRHTMSRAEVVQKIKLAQRQFSLTEDGILGPATRAALNTPLLQRIEELNVFLNDLRWLEQLRQTSAVIIINLPSATFFLYDEGQLLMDSKLIVGKPSTPTPTLTSTITEVILYPYWMVPHKIATKELLPRIKRNIGFLEANRYQVLSRQGTIVNPYNINWWALSTGYFPYIIRQSTGCDNALGIVKFNFYNPFTVYLHDTPTKDLFASDRRFYSHGCMRVEKPVELARYLLGFNRIAIDTLTEKGCLQHQSPVVVPVQKALPVVVLYSTVWYDREGALRFYEDVYGRLKTFPSLRAVTEQRSASAFE